MNTTLKRPARSKPPGYGRIIEPGELLLSTLRRLPVESNMLSWPCCISVTQISPLLLTSTEVAWTNSPGPSPLASNRADKCTLRVEYADLLCLVVKDKGPALRIDIKRANVPKELGSATRIASDPPLFLYLPRLRPEWVIGILDLNHGGGKGIHRAGPGSAHIGVGRPAADGKQEKRQGEGEGGWSGSRRHG